MKHLVIRSVLVWLAVSALAGIVCAQVYSGAFDPKCYQPVIGQPGVIDTIVGPRKDSYLGGGVVNIGPKPNNPGGPGRLMMGGLAGDRYKLTAVDCGPNFDAHNMSLTQIKGFYWGSRMEFGHFHSRDKLDVLLVDSAGSDAYPKIFWADDSGNYDASRYTKLFPQQKTDIYSVHWMIPPYHSYLTSDSAEDIIIIYNSAGHGLSDSVYFARFSGGDALYTSGTSATSVEECFFDTIHATNIQYAPIRYSYQGHFSNTDHDDLFSLDVFGNAFLYRRDVSFSLQSFAAQMRDDTLLSAWDDPRISKLTGWGLQGTTLGSGGQRSKGRYDRLALHLDSNGASWKSPQIRIFQGGPDFGKHRLTIDSALTIHEPEGVDSTSMQTAEWRTMSDCGDMTGTGANVLCLSGLDFLSGIYAFYVLDPKPDEYVDMFIGGFNLQGTLDTCTIDGDGLQDIAIGAPYYNPENVSNVFNGTVLFVHGSKLIPVAGRNVRSSGEKPAKLWVRATDDGHSLAIHTTGSDAGDIASLQLFDILGRVVLSGDVALAGDQESIVSIPHLPHGTYVLQLQSRGRSYEEKFIL